MKEITKTDLKQTTWPEMIKMFGNKRAKEILLNSIQSYEDWDRVRDCEFALQNEQLRLMVDEKLVYVTFDFITQATNTKICSSYIKPSTLAKMVIRTIELSMLPEEVEALHRGLELECDSDWTDVQLRLRCASKTAQIAVSEALHNKLCTHLCTFEKAIGALRQHICAPVLHHALKLAETVQDCCQLTSVSLSDIRDSRRFYNQRAVEKKALRLMKTPEDALIIASNVHFSLGIVANALRFFMRTTTAAECYRLLTDRSEKERFQQIVESIPLEAFVVYGLLHQIAYRGLSTISTIEGLKPLLDELRWANFHELRLIPGRALALRSAELFTTMADVRAFAEHKKQEHVGSGEYWWEGLAAKELCFFLDSAFGVAQTPDEIMEVSDLLVSKSRQQLKSHQERTQRHLDKL